MLGHAVSELSKEWGRQVCYRNKNKLHLPPSSIIYADILNVLSNFYFYFYQILTAFNMFKIMSEVAHYKLVAHDSFKLTFI